MSQRNNLDYNQDVKQGGTNISVANKLNMLSQILQMNPSKRQSMKATPAPSNIQKILLVGFNENLFDYEEHEDIHFAKQSLID